MSWISNYSSTGYGRLDLILLLKAEDNEQNPVPQTGTSVSTANSSSLASGTSMNLSTLQNKLFIVHYNVQSITRKIDILSSELLEFDILAFQKLGLIHLYTKKLF